MRVQTVNVIQMEDGSFSIPIINSYPDSESGNKEAEKFFTEVISLHNCSEDEIDIYIEAGKYEHGDYQAFLAHSE